MSDDEEWIALLPYLPPKHWESPLPEYRLQPEVIKGLQPRFPACLHRPPGLKALPGFRLKPVLRPTDHR